MTQGGNGRARIETTMKMPAPDSDPGSAASVEMLGVSDGVTFWVETPNPMTGNAQVLKVSARPGNTVSTVIRDAWDQGVLSPLTKNSRIQATHPHISIIGHITTSELKRLLSETECANGFANRFFWLCSKRSKLLPRGGQFHQEDVQPIVTRIRHAVEFARTVKRIDRSEEAWQTWEQIYGPLSAGKPGLLGAVLGRAEAQVTRLSTLYAVLARSGVILPEHQEAALAGHHLTS